jgi:hypothetical protein
MLKKASIAFLFVFLLGLTSFAQETCNKVLEKEGGISYCAPLNWTVTKEAGEKYQTIFGETVNGLTPNMNIKDETAKAALSDYVELSNKNILAGVKEIGATSIKLESQSDFAATSMRGFKVVWQVNVNGIKVRSVQYYFSGKNDRKYVITGTALAADKEVMDSVFDKSMKTFELIN